ncbi:ABC transporter permease/M1 family aminopeptidase [Aquimarina sp. 2201CG5-10]|uniref:ABC transporter permease/M1 family aminopeptidase n=1 Tax=Aquimarina callyspongiae TaxID=3098150 RepID=UPI002AB5105F|nr:M1 family aminopeptidase [Aquimarina sp. 2201CG5-10]MDY8135274.1 M1 family aminopeptidase [Aquimarina sp. 2201CG5-10]
MFTHLFKFEWKYHTKQLSFYMFSAIFFLLGFYMSSGGRLGATELVKTNSPYQISFFVGIFSLVSVFATMFYCINAMIRDRRYFIEEIIYSTPLKKYQFYWSRFAGTFLVSLLVFTLLIVGFAIGTFFSMDPDSLLPFNIFHYVYIWAILILPNLFILTALLFSFATLSRKALVVYIGAVFIYALYWGCAIFFNSPMLAQAVPPSPENMIIASLADPFGLSAFFEQTMYWTPFQKNTQLVSFSGYFMLNRVFWVIISLVLLGITYKLFSFRKGNRRIKKDKEVSEMYTEEKTYTPVLTFIQTRKARLLGLFSLAKLELSNVFRGLPFIAVMLIWVLISVTEIYSRIFEGGTYHDSQYPATYRLIELTSEGLPMLGLILIIFYSGELVWRERNLTINGIIDTTPTTNSIFFFSKYIALLILPLFLVLISIFISIGFQVIGDYHDFKWNQYINLFYLQGVQMIFYGILALFVQNVVSNKYVGMFISGILIFFLGSSLSNHIGIEYPLLKLGRTPLVIYNDMVSYGYYLKSFHWYSIYWLSLGGILVLLAFKLWRRGAVSNFRFRILQLFSGWKKIERLTIIGFLIVFMGSGSVIFYNINILNKYYLSNERLNLSEMYEKKFKQYDTLEELYPVDLKTEVDVYPEDKKYRVKANYVLKNKSNTNVESVFISPRIPLESVYLENATLIEHDSIFKTYLFQLQSPLYPDEKLTFRYQLTVENDGFETKTDIVNNGSYILHSSFEPSLGYRPSMEIRDSKERKNRGLPEREEEVTEERDLHEGSDNLIGRVSFETVVSTQADQTAIAPGNLIKHWTSENRNYYHYKAKEKISPLLGYFSARYKIHKENHRGVSIEQYYHPDHDMNVELITKASKEAMDYCLQNFGAYPFDHIRIAEIPGYWPFGGQAMPGTISMVEDNLYLLDQRNSSVFNLVAKRTIHEVAHQWWGHILTPKMTVGGGFFIEGLAKYTEIVVMEKHYGKGVFWNLSEYSNNRYFTGRSYASEMEPPAYLSDGEGYILYGKDYTIMLALKELIGVEKIDNILQKMVTQYRGKEEFEAITLDFLNEVYQVTPPDYHTLVDDWFKRIITYDLEVKNTSYEKLSNGKYKITLDLITKRLEAKKLGEDVPISIQEPIQIGLFQKHPKEIGVGEQPLYLQSHNFDKENSQISIIVDKLPTYVSIDPYGTRLDKNRVNNIKRL